MDHGRPLRPVKDDQLQKVPGFIRAEHQVAARVLADLLDDTCMAQHVIDAFGGHAMAMRGPENLHTQGIVLQNRPAERSQRRRTDLFALTPAGLQCGDLPRTAIKQDLLFTLGSAMSIFTPSKNNAVARLEHLLAHGTDPGAAGAPLSSATTVGASEQAVDEPELSANIEEVALDQITSKVSEEFAGHGLAALVAAVLEAEGYRCTVSPPGPDGGVDIAAGRGPLGLDSPRLVVQVKSGAQIGAPVVSQLHGVMSTYGADQGLLVAWGGLTKQARDLLKNQQLRVRVWEAAEVIDAVLRTYDRLPEEMRTAVSLRRVWMLSDSGP